VDASDGFDAKSGGPVLAVVRGLQIGPAVRKTLSRRAAKQLMHGHRRTGVPTRSEPLNQGA